MFSGSAIHYCALKLRTNSKKYAAVVVSYALRERIPPTLHFWLREVLNYSSFELCTVFSNAFPHRMRTPCTV